MKKLLTILTFSLMVTGFLMARGNNSASISKTNVDIKINKYYFDIGSDSDLLYKKRSHKRRKIKRKARRGRDNR